MKKTTRRLARTAGPAAVLTGMAAVAVAGLPGTASAAPICFGAKQTKVVTSARVATVTCIFGYVDGEQSFQVPNGVYHANVDLVSGWGGNGYLPSDEIYGWGGVPNEVYATIPVQPHQILYIEVGGSGGDGGSSTGGTAGFNGGASGAGGLSGGGGGGGASDIRTIPMVDTGSTLQSRLIVAGGGGGGGGRGSCADNGGFGGFIYDDNSGGSNGGGCTSGNTEGGGSGGANATGVNGGGSGGGGSDGSGTGTGGSYGTAGSLGAGGAGGGSAGGGGGGGGGGLAGGGGAGSGARTSNGALYGGGGGGGGGTSGTTNLGVRWTDFGPNGDYDNGVVSLKFQQPTAPPRPLRGHSLTSATAADKAVTARPRLSGRRP